MLLKKKKQKTQKEVDKGGGINRGNEQNINMKITERIPNISIITLYTNNRNVNSLSAPLKKIVK